MTASRAALVTGGSSGIGFAIARMLADEGHAVTIAALGTGLLEEAVDRLRANGADTLGVEVNVADPHALDAVVDAHREAYGRLDVLVNNVGVATQAAIDEMPDSRIDLQFGVNIRSVVRAYRAALPMLRIAAKEHGCATVVNTASIAAKNPEAGLSIYSTTKAAVVGFTHAMNKELGPEGIKSTALCPGMVATPMSRSLQERVPAEDMIQPEDIAELVRALMRLGPSCLVAELDIGRAGGLAW